MTENLKKEDETEESITVSNGIYARYIKRLADFFSFVVRGYCFISDLACSYGCRSYSYEGQSFFSSGAPG